MDAVDIVKVCARRWYVMLPVLVGAAGVSSQLAQEQETTYTAAASFGLVQSELTPGGGDDPGANPLGAGGDVLVGAALEAQLNSRETQELLGGGDTRGWGPGEVVNRRYYTVRIPQFETTYEVRTWGEDEQEVRDVVEQVIKAAPDFADALQARANVQPPQRYQPFVLAPTQVDVLPSSGWLKLVLAVMGVGLLMGAAWSVVVDRALRWREVKRQALVGSSAAKGPSDEAGAPRQAAPSATGPPLTDSSADGKLTGRLNGEVHANAAGAATGGATRQAPARTSGTADTPVNLSASGKADGTTPPRTNVRANGGPGAKTGNSRGRKPANRR